MYVAAYSVEAEPPFPVCGASISGDCFVFLDENVAFLQVRIECDVAAAQEALYFFLLRRSLELLQTSMHRLSVSQSNKEFEPL